MYLPMPVSAKRYTGTVYFKSSVSSFKFRLLQYRYLLNTDLSLVRAGVWLNSETAVELEPKLNNSDIAPLGNHTDVTGSGYENMSLKSRVKSEAGKV